MGAPSLLSLAKHACIRNINALTDIGDIPYEQIRPVLLKLQNPRQLHQLEQSSPHLIGVDAEIWRELIKRDIPGWQGKLDEPEDPAAWYATYQALHEASEQEVDQDALILQAAMQGINAAKAERTSRFVDPSTVPKLPRMGGMRVERSANGVKVSSDSRHGAGGLGARGRVTTGKSLLEKTKRDIREFRHQTAKGVIAKPGSLTTKTGIPINTLRRTTASDYAIPTAVTVKIHAPRRTSFAKHPNRIPSKQASTLDTKRNTMTSRPHPISSSPAKSLPLPSQATPSPKRTAAQNSHKTPESTVSRSTTAKAISQKACMPASAIQKSPQTVASTTPTRMPMPPPKRKAGDDIFMPKKRR